MSSYNNGTETWNCKVYPGLRANPDIGGIGILVAFIASAYITFLCCIAKFQIDRFRSPDKLTPSLDIWSFSLRAVILSFSDQQVVIGISIILGGFSQLKSGLDSYHWQTVANLAWFSAFTHITTLTVLRNEDICSRTIKILRIAAMGVLLRMLLCVFYSLGWLAGLATSKEGVVGNTPSDFPAWCTYHPGMSWGYTDRNGINTMTVQYNWLYTALTLAILIFGYSTRVLLLFFDHTSQAMHNFSRHLKLNRLWGILTSYGIPKMRSFESILEAMGRTWWKYRILRCIYAMVLSFQQLHSSIVFEFTWLFLVLLWGPIRIFVMRNPGSTITVLNIDEPWSEFYSDVLSQENSWAFGQVVALVLLILPFLGFAEAYLTPPEPNTLQKKATPEIRSSINNLPFQSVIQQTNNIPLRNSASCPRNATPIREELAKEPWYKGLLVVWYLQSIILVGSAILFFPVDGGNRILVSSQHVRGLVELYAQWIALHLATIWVTTIILIDRDVQGAWKQTRIRTILSKKTYSWDLCRIPDPNTMWTLDDLLYNCGSWVLRWTY